MDTNLTLGRSELNTRIEKIFDGINEEMKLMQMDLYNEIDFELKFVLFLMINCERIRSFVGRIDKQWNKVVVKILEKIMRSYSVVDFFIPDLRNRQISIGVHMREKNDDTAAMGRLYRYLIRSELGCFVVVIQYGIFLDM